MESHDDERYASLGLGCYALDACHDGTWYSFDATANINDPGRFINHASRNNNISLIKPIRIGERLRIGFVAKCNIRQGDELFYDYGVRDEEIPWLVSNAKVLQCSKTNKKLKNRVRLNCPVKHCISQQRSSAGFVKLSQHLMQYHCITDRATQEKLCADARQVCSA